MARRVLVTGASGSIGYEVSLQLLAAGWSVVVHSRLPSDRIDELKRRGAVWWQSDFDSRVTDIPDSLDGLVNCAGVLLTKRLVHETDLDELETTLRVNLIVPFLLSKAALPFMMSNGWGRIVNIGSIYSLRGTDHNGAYNASKHGLSGLTRSLAKEYAEFGITVNEVCPAAVQSDLMLRIAADKASGGGISASGYLEAVAAALPSKRMPLPEEIAAVVSFLLSEQASMVNGVSIPVDGGLIC